MLITLMMIKARLVVKNETFIYVNMSVHGKSLHIIVRSIYVVFLYQTAGAYRMHPVTNAKREIEPRYKSAEFSIKRMTRSRDVPTNW